MPKGNYQMPLIDGSDPSTIEYYIQCLMNCSDALLAIKQKQPCFVEAQYEARNKDMLCIYMMLDSIHDLIEELRESNAFRQSRGDGLRAVMEVLPEYAISELMRTEERRRKGKGA